MVWDDLRYLQLTGMASEQRGVVPALSQEAVLLSSASMPEGSVEVKGYDWKDPLDYRSLLQSYATSGFQATNFGLAVEQIKSMVQ